MTKASGYKVEAEWDGSVLTARGTTKAGKIALLGEGHKEGEVRIGAASITGVEFKPARMWGAVNGNLIVTTAVGKKYQMHFRAKDEPEWRALAVELGAVGV